MLDNSTGKRRESGPHETPSGQLWEAAIHQALPVPHSEVEGERLPSFRFRGATPYHGDADEQLRKLTAGFEDLLEARANSLIEQDGLSTVDVKHVVRAYDDLVARDRKRKLGELLGSAACGASFSALITFLVLVVDADGEPSPWYVALLVFFLVSTLVSLGVTVWSAKG
jgi:hypothetical protein